MNSGESTGVTTGVRGARRAGGVGDLRSAFTRVKSRGRAGDGVPTPRRNMGDHAILAIAKKKKKKKMRRTKQTTSEYGNRTNEAGKKGKAK